jgi:hypothetical protein
MKIRKTGILVIGLLTSALLMACHRGVKEGPYPALSVPQVALEERDTIVILDGAISGKIAVENEALRRDAQGRLEVFANIRNHLGDGGLFVASVATFEHRDPGIGATWHVTVKDRKWWLERLAKQGFEMADGFFEPADFARGSGNIYNRYDWSVLTNPELGFHIVAQQPKRTIESPPRMQPVTEDGAAAVLPSRGLPNSMVCGP